MSARATAPAAALPRRLLAARAPRRLLRPRADPGRLSPADRRQRQQRRHLPRRIRAPSRGASLSQVGRARGRSPKRRAHRGRGLRGRPRRPAAGDRSRLLRLRGRLARRCRLRRRTRRRTRPLGSEHDGRATRVESRVPHRPGLSLADGDLAASRSASAVRRPSSGACSNRVPSRLAERLSRLRKRAGVETSQSGCVEGRDPPRPCRLARTSPIRP